MESEESEPSSDTDRVDTAEDDEDVDAAMVNREEGTEIGRSISESSSGKEEANGTAQRGTFGCVLCKGSKKSVSSLQFSTKKCATACNERWMKG